MYILLEIYTFFARLKLHMFNFVSGLNRHIARCSNLVVLDIDKVENGECQSVLTSAHTYRFPSNTVHQASGGVETELQGLVTEVNVYGFCPSFGRPGALNIKLYVVLAIRMSTSFPFDKGILNHKHFPDASTK